jgi:phenylacetate-CoA ligase
MRTELLPAFNLTSETLATFVSRIRNRRPRMLFGYPSAISLIANHARRMNADLSKLGIRVVFVTSELLYDHQRDLISNVFGCPVANGYGGRDAGFVAHECPSGGMHITAEDILVEVIDDNGAPLPHGMPGEIVVTHLATSDFPFIRYRTGDRGVLSPDPCSCGRGLPLLAEIQGRSTDFVVAQDGTIMHGLALIYVLREIVGIRQFRIVQESCELVRAEIVTAKEGNQDQIERAVVSGFKARLGQGVNVQVDFLPMISSERSGKFRYVVSHVVTSREPSYHTHA